ARELVRAAGGRRPCGAPAGARGGGGGGGRARGGGGGGRRPRRPPGAAGGGRGGGPRPGGGGGGRTTPSSPTAGGSGGKGGGGGGGVAAVGSGRPVEVCEPTADPATPLRWLCAREVPAGPFGLAVSPDEGTLAVTSAWEPALTSFDMTMAERSRRRLSQRAP